MIPLGLHLGLVRVRQGSGQLLVLPAGRSPSGKNAEGTHGSLSGCVVLLFPRLFLPVTSARTRGSSRVLRQEPGLFPRIRLTNSAYAPLIGLTPWSNLTDSMDDLRAFVDFVEEAAGGLPDRPGPLFIDPPPVLFPRSQSIPMLKRSSTVSSASASKRSRANKAAVAKVTRIARNVALKTHELKETNVTSTGTATTTSLGFTLLNGLAQSTGSSGRLGRDVYIEKVLLRYELDTTANTPDMIRVLVIFDKECRGAVPTSSDVVQSAVAGFMQVSSTNGDNRDVRFRILYDKTHAINSSTTTAAVYGMHTAVIPVKRKSHYYDNASSGIAAIDSGSIYLCYVSRTGGLTTIMYDSVVQYRDI